MDIREATIDDVPKILPVWREFMEFHAQRDGYFAICEGAEEAFASYVRENIEKDDSCVFVAQENDEIVGYCQCHVAKTPPVFETKIKGDMGDLAVIEKYRRNGIGEQMFERAMQWFRSKGLERVEVRVAVTNEISTQFWRKMGFSTYLETMSKQVDLPEPS